MSQGDRESHIATLILFVALLAWSLAGCATPYSSDKYQRTTQIGPAVWTPSLDGIRCESVPHSSAEVGLALEAVLFAFDERGLLAYSNEALERMKFYEREHGPMVCFVGGNTLGQAGRSRVKGVWVSLGDKDGNSLAIKDTALAHEMIHQVLMRSCFLGRATVPPCSEDGTHADSRLWGVGGVEGRANQIWRAGR